MKTLYLIGGTMGVGKTALCRELQTRLNRCVFLDGDWCWDMRPFQVTAETKVMVMDNICHILNNFIRCPAYENILFCWVMHEQSIIDEILSRLDRTDCQVVTLSLICSAENLRNRLQKDIDAGIRTSDILARSVARLPLYEKLNTVKINTDGKTTSEVADLICRLTTQNLDC